MKSHFKFSVKFLLFYLFFSACTSEKQTENTANKFDRPLDTWVFRSVLDEHPRVLTVALHKNLWVAYDVQTATVFKTWSGNVKLQGAVYDTKHGPQPKSQGLNYFKNGNKEEWLLFKDEKEFPATVNYLGHEFKNGSVVINFELKTPEGELIKISESPEYQTDISGMIRTFQIENSTAYQPALRTSISALKNESDYKTTGNFLVKNKEEHEAESGKLTELEGVLFLNKKTVSLSNTFHSDFEKIAGEFTPNETPSIELNAAAVLIEKNDCPSCHNEKLKTTGPSYLSIARRYNDAEPTIDLLTSRVKNGSQGIWGIAQMTPHPKLSKTDAENMVKYILSLDDNEEKEADLNTLGIKTKPFVLVDKFSGTSGKGLMVNQYFDVKSEDILKLEKKHQPVKQGVVSALHALSESDFGGRPENFASVIRGYVNVEKEQEISFRLISDDASYLFIDNKMIIDNGGNHGAVIVDGEVTLTPGKHPIKILHHQGGGGAFLSFQYFDKVYEKYELVTDKMLSFDENDVLETVPYDPPKELVGTPGNGAAVAGVHPSFDLFQARPDNFEPKVGGIDFLSDGRMVVCTWEPEGPVFIIENWQSGNAAEMSFKKIASGLAEPLGLKVVNDEIYVLQKQELTKLIDHDGDDVIDEYRAHSYGWKVSANFHEFAFGLVYKKGFFYATLATAILPGGASAVQIPDRGKVVKISEKDGSTELIAHGLRTPNGVGIGVDEEIFIADNQGDWLPASKIVHVKKDAFFGSRSVDFEGTEGLKTHGPVVWLPQDEIGNSPSTPIFMDKGIYAGQMIHGEVTHGGIKRVFVEKVNGNYQGVVFRFTQGLEAGVNRILWAPDGSLMVGGVGAPGNWGHSGKLWYGLQRLVFNEKSTFEMLSVSARSNGFEIELTEPIAENKAFSSADIDIQQWKYVPTKNYGGPKVDLKKLKASNVVLSEDRKKISINLPGMKAGHVVYFRLNDSLESASDQSLWSTEAWYTLNAIPR